MKYQMYIPRLANGKYYTGITRDLNKRMEEHAKGLVISTKGYLPVKLVFHQAFLSKSEARKYEVKIKAWSQEKKEKLISFYPFPRDSSNRSVDYQGIEHLWSFQTIGKMWTRTCWPGGNGTMKRRGRLVNSRFLSETWFILEVLNGLPYVAGEILSSLLDYAIDMPLLPA